VTGVRVAVRALRPTAVIPVAARTGDAGVDLHAAAGVELAAAGGRGLVPTGLAIAVPEGFGGFVLPRSGLAVRSGVTVLNAPGLIDAGYRGEVLVSLVNTDPTNAVVIEEGERIAQLLVLPVPVIEWVLVDELPPTLGTGSQARGGGGFGHSGRA
jgi:dUTP pyrophosphatase